MNNNNKGAYGARIPLLGRLLPQAAYALLVVSVAEFIGTVFFLFFALAGCQVAFGQAAPVVAGRSSASLLYAALSVGFSFVVNAWVFFKVTSALFNPAIALGMCIIGKMAWQKCIAIITSQILAGMAAAGIVSCMFPGELKAETLLGTGTSVVRGFFIEVLLTAAFVFSVFVMAAYKNKGTVGGSPESVYRFYADEVFKKLAPVSIGLALFIAQLVAGPYTGASLNPARSFGPAVANHHFPGYHWVYWVGPLLGSVLAAGFYKIVKFLEVEVALEDQSGNLVGHNQGATNVDTAHANKPLEPVAEVDLERGPKPTTEIASPAEVHSRHQYLSGCTFTSELSADSTEKKALSPKSSIKAGHQRENATT